MKMLVVLSGGQDSATCLFWAKEALRGVANAQLHAITFDYGQRHRIEIEAACKVAMMAGVTSHEIIQVPNCLVSTSPLTSTNDLERYKDFVQMAKVIGDRVEHTFVPMRNTLFLTIAANRAVALDCWDIITGVCQEDNANYPDCRQDFINSMQNSINRSLGFNYEKIKIRTPLMFMSKKRTVQMARELPGCWEALAYTHTSYDGKYPPTDMNHSNVLRAQGFFEANLPDPLVVRAWREGLMALPASTNYDKPKAEQLMRCPDEGCPHFGTYHEHKE
jgi:7-cyano-7-deazaguanine synthase